LHFLYPAIPSHAGSIGVTDTILYHFKFLLNWVASFRFKRVVNKSNYIGADKGWGEKLQPCFIPLSLYRFSVDIKAI